jgi:hypothetical protein
MNAFVTMAVLAGMSVDDAVASCAPGAETRRQASLLRSPDRAVRAHALAVGVGAIVRGLEALDIAAKTSAPAVPAPSPRRV